MKTRYTHIPGGSRASAFTLIELLLVIVLIGILMGLVLPNAMQITSGISIATGGQLVQDRFAFGRQLAVTRNRLVEIRFLKTPDTNSVSQSHFQMLQIWLYDANGNNPLAFDKAVCLPNGVIFDAVAGADGEATTCSSTLIDSAPYQGYQRIPGKGATNFPYRAFRYRPNGSTDLHIGGANSDTWYVTVRRLLDKPQGNSLPKNYCTVQVNPLTGQTKVFRP